jgi:murein DD-endopeptidase MepM/ murein hydrolase activator NlpD
MRLPRISARARRADGSPRARRTAALRRALHALRVALPTSLALAALILIAAQRRLEAYCASPCPVSAAPAFHPALVARSPYPSVAARIAADAAAVPVEYRFERGDTVGGVLQDLGLAPAEASAATRALGEHLDLRRVRAGQRFAVLAGPDARPTRLRFDLDGQGRILLDRGADGWSSAWQPFERSLRTRAVAGSLDDSLEAAVRAAGADPRLTLRMADALQWDLDFNRDLQPGDRFEVLFEEVYLDGRFYAPGGVVALAYDNAGRRLEAYRYGDGYYDAEGRPLKKMFLRSPLAYSRITSRFSHKRFHPVLKTYRPHYGVDYGAQVGTPVRATAGGVVVSAGWSGGGGKTVKVRHPNGYLTAYLHLSRFAQGIGPGRRVRQGDVIAYTGSTGLSSGPHLDYRVQRNGRWIDPLSLKNLPAEPIAVSERPAFVAWRDACRESLATGAPLSGSPGAGGGFPPVVTAAAAAPGPAPAVGVAGR